MAVFVELTPGDAVAIGKSVVRMERKSGQRCRLSIQSPEGVSLVKDGEVPARLKDTRATQARPLGDSPYLKPPTLRESA